MPPSPVAELSKRLPERGAPLLVVEGKTLPEVWEAAVVRLAEEGVRMPTEYDPGEQSLDAAMVMVVREPMAEPRVHCGAAVGRLSFYDEYVAEVLEGINDEEVYRGVLSYTYHQRLTDYTSLDASGRPEQRGRGVDQVHYIVEKLVKAPYSRRAQAITWNPFSDPRREDPPCLQRLWFRIYKDARGRQFLALHTHWRSRDALHAAFLNMYALTLLQERIARSISEQTGNTVMVGQYIDISDSFHVYERAQDNLIRFLKTAHTLQPEKKFWTTGQLREFIKQTSPP